MTDVAEPRSRRPFCRRSSVRPDQSSSCWAKSVRQDRQSRHGRCRHPRLPLDKDVSAHAGQGLPLRLTVGPLPIGAALPPGIFVVRSHASRHSCRYGTYRDTHHFPYHQTDQYIFVTAPTSMALVRFAGLPMLGVERCFPSYGHHRAPDMTGPGRAIGPCHSPPLRQRILVVMACASLRGPPIRDVLRALERPRTGLPGASPRG